MKTKVIHLEWNGPFSREDIKDLNKNYDYGIYQIYGKHPLYPASSLLYIGLACEQTFGVRILQHGWCLGTCDSENLEFYVGRIIGPDKLSNPEWTEAIHIAERLLICAHFPVYNTQVELASLSLEAESAHVLNWKNYRDLFPEVSGERWSDKHNHISYETYLES